MTEHRFGREFLVARFADGDGLLHAVRVINAHGFRVHDAYTPYPVHGLDAAMGIRRSRLPWAALAGGVIGGVSMFAFEFYTTTLAWRLNVGGKPDNSTLAFVPVAFEITILGAALCIAAACFIRCRLWPGAPVRGADFGATDDRFVLAMRWLPGPGEGSRAQHLLYDAGACDVTRRVAQL
jgi:Alternative complex III, ActD subunit